MKARISPAAILRDARFQRALRMRAEYAATQQKWSLLLGLLAARLHLAVARCAAFADGLWAALQRHGIVGHVARDHRARADIGAVADCHRRDQRGVGADEGTLPDDRLVLL